MRTGPIVHGALLVAALLVAYQTWTREDNAEPTTGSVVVWNQPVASLEAVALNKEKRTTRIERRDDDGGAYYWGIDKQTRPAPRKPEPPKPDPAAALDGGVAPADAGAAAAATATDAGAAAEPPPAPEPEEPADIVVENEFPVGEAGEQLFEHFASLRAVRDLGVPSDEERDEYGLADSTESLAVVFTAGTRTLVLGGQVYGGADRYALDVDNDHAYVLSNEVLKPILSGEFGLRLKKMHAFDKDAVAGVRLQVGERSRELVAVTVEGEDGKAKTRTWAPKESPTTPDQTLANFVDQVDKLAPTRYLPKADVSSLERLVRLEHLGDGGAVIGWIELYRDPSAAGAEPPAPGQPPAPEYLLVTERTRVPGEVPAMVAQRVAQDLEQIFAD